MRNVSLAFCSGNKGEVGPSFEGVDSDLAPEMETVDVTETVNVVVVVEEGEAMMEKGLCA